MRNTNHDPNRRRLLRGLAATGLLAGFESLLPAYARIKPAGRHLGGAAASVTGGAPRDVVMDFHIRREGIAIANGYASSAFTVNHNIPAPLLELWEGRTALLRIHNHIPDELTSIHWHGILLPFQMDGVTGVSFPGIAPGGTFEAHFPVRQSGTYWYHSHAALQEQNCLTGPIVIHPAEPQRHPADRDYVIVLNDWTFEDPHRVLAKLKESSDYYNFNQRTVGDFFADIHKNGFKKTVADRLAWGRMDMSPRDIADVTGHTYTYLMNGLSPQANWTGLFNAGEKVRLRVINASSMTYFNFRIPDLPMTVVSADGNDIEPVETDEFQIAVAETFDVIVEPEAGTAYTLMAESMDRSGYARGTLAPHPGMTAAVPPLRKPPQHTMADMGMDMGSMGMSQQMAPKSPMGNMSMAGKATTGMDRAKSSGQSMSSMSGGKMSSGSMSGMAMGGAGMNNLGPIIARQNPANFHYSIENLHIPENLRYRLDERGLGLKNVPHRVLTYSQLRNVKPLTDQRPP
jgi:CopA family copper-resistance protein